METYVMNVRPLRLDREPGEYVMLLDGRVIWESPGFTSSRPAEDVKEMSEHIRTLHPTARLFLKVGGQD